MQAEGYSLAEKGISLQRDTAVEEPVAGMRRLRAGDNGGRPPRGDVGAVHKTVVFENQLPRCAGFIPVFRLALQIHRRAGDFKQAVLHKGAAAGEQLSPRVVNAELKEVIPLVSRPTIPLAILTRRFVWVITLAT